MSKITISDGCRPYKCTVDTEAMDVELRDVFLGVRFLTDQSAALSVCMRDNGFEVRYVDNINEQAFSGDCTVFKDGKIILPKEALDIDIDETDRCARAYGFEIGRGHELVAMIDDVSPDNPFIVPNWKVNLKE